MLGDTPDVVEVVGSHGRGPLVRRLAAFPRAWPPRAAPARAVPPASCDTWCLMSTLGRQLSSVAVLVALVAGCSGSGPSVSSVERDVYVTGCVAGFVGSYMERGELLEPGVAEFMCGCAFDEAYSRGYTGMEISSARGTGLVVTDEMLSTCAARYRTTAG